jgi:hypothetical protein
MSIVSHPANQNYRDNFDEVFGKKERPAAENAADVENALTASRFPHLRVTTHRYCDHQTTTDYANGCGAWMGGSRSGGPTPFGECPKREVPPKTLCKRCKRLPQENYRPSVEAPQP